MSLHHLSAYFTGRPPVVFTHPASFVYSSMLLLLSSCLAPAFTEGDQEENRWW